MIVCCGRGSGGMHPPSEGHQRIPALKALLIIGRHHLEFLHEMGRFRELKVWSGIWWVDVRGNRESQRDVKEDQAHRMRWGGGVSLGRGRVTDGARWEQFLGGCGFNLKLLCGLSGRPRSSLRGSHQIVCDLHVLSFLVYGKDDVWELIYLSLFNLRQALLKEAIITCIPLKIFCTAFLSFQGSNVHACSFWFIFLAFLLNPIKVVRLSLSSAFSNLSSIVMLSECFASWVVG